MKTCYIGKQPTSGFRPWQKKRRVLKLPNEMVALGRVVVFTLVLQSGGVREVFGIPECDPYLSLFRGWEMRVWALETKRPLPPPEIACRRVGVFGLSSVVVCDPVLSCCIEVKLYYSFYWFQKANILTFSLMMISSVQRKTKITENSHNSSRNIFLPTRMFCFSIFRRLSTIVNADQILVVHDGEIIERGR